MTLRAHRTRQAMEAKLMGTAWRGSRQSDAPDAFVFTTSVGTWMDPT